MKKDKIKLLIWSDAVVETGFARVAHSIVKYLPSYYDISWIGINYNGDPHNYKKERIYPASIRGDVYGLNRFQEVVAKELPDKIFMVNDAWIINPMLEKIKKTYDKVKLPNVYTYIPVDAKDHDSEWYSNFDIVTKAVAYTEFGKNEIIKALPDVENKISVIPHGIDNSVFYKIPKTKEELKKALYPNRADFYDNSFIIFNGNRNQPRKRIDITMLAFKMFSEGKPENVKLYLHMGVIDSHINLQKMAKRLGIDNRLIITSYRGGVQTVSTERLNLIYNATDVGLNTSTGEGWGLVNMEHAVTGAPQVVGSHSSLTNLYSDCGLLVEPITSYTLDNIMTTGYIVRPEDVAEKLEMLYNNKELYEDLSRKGIEKFSASEYSWKTISRRWSKLFEE